ncbi:diguanylate cyclase domain-containing protein [Vibrio sinaloensis]|uniref:diguanylate cyclase domain-containing protein n=1 Tax=Photobacterium sp. (strain ATCC 43367) TaxID=379097 RepID=UPI002F41517E
MKNLYSYVIKNYLLLTTIPFFIFGGLDIANDIYFTHNVENAQYQRVIDQQQTDSKRALLNFDLLEAELVATRISQLDYIVSVTLDSYQYGMKMAEIINSNSTRGVPLYYPIFDDQRQQIGQLIVVKDYSAYYTQVIYNVLPRAIGFLLILCAISLLFSRILTSALKKPFLDLQRFALQIASGDYQTPSKTDSSFVEITNIFRALETMRAKLKESISKLKLSEERYSRTYNLTQVCLFVVNVKHGKIVRSNQKFNQVLERIPQAVRQSALQHFIDELITCASTESFRHSLDVGGKQRYFQINRSDIYNHEIECSALDITELVTAKQTLESQLVTDVLTQVPNRYRFNQLIWRVNNGELNTVTVLMIDLNGFKQINDTYGHAAGDYLLVEIAKRIKQQLKLSTQTVYRLGGDEFVVTVHDSITKDQVQDLAMRIQAACSQPVQYINKSFSVSLSIGVESFNSDIHLDLERCLNNADAAMYLAKTSKTGIVYASEHPENSF